MANVMLIAVLLLTVVCGYWLMGRLDRYLNEHVRRGEDEDEPDRGGSA